eukprot:GHVT01006304.1.p1 GENE.GHVT01006304.1~~GHVT01006304.1.p1  ORF type:complete len:104 (-),score=16.21 GHVT01006304.1:203-514(-)
MTEVMSLNRQLNELSGHYQALKVVVERQKEELTTHMTKHVLPTVEKAETDGLMTFAVEASKSTRNVMLLLQREVEAVTLDENQLFAILKLMKKDFKVVSSRRT